MDEFSVQNPWDLYLAIKEGMPSMSADEICREAAFDRTQERYSTKALIGTDKKLPFHKYRVYQLFVVEELTGEEAFKLVINELEKHPERREILFNQLNDEVTAGVNRFPKLEQYQEMVLLLMKWQENN